MSDAMRLGTLIDGLGIRPAGGGAAGEGWAETPVEGIDEDSRLVRPGWVFVARPGASVDGRRHAPAAVAGGAVAVLTDDASAEGVREVAAAGVPVLEAEDVARAGAVMAERLAGGPSASLDVVGVTGTNGKTTTAGLVRQLLEAGGRRCGLIGTVEVDDGRGAVPSTYTTPPAAELSRALASMVAHGCDSAAVEVSSHALEQRRADGVRFRVGVFTNLSGDHLDYHADEEAYAGAKARLFEMLPTDGLAVVNGDDPRAARMVAGCAARVVWCREGGEGDQGGTESAWVEVGRSGVDGTPVRLAGPWGEIAGVSPLIGAFNAMNLLQAVVVVDWLGVDAGVIERALGGLRPPAGRLEPVVVEGEGLPRVLVDFAHTDDALGRVLGAVRGAMVADGRVERGGRLWVVFGCGGDRDRSKRPRMGRAAAEGADVVVVTSDNPRTEPPARITDEIVAGVAEGLRGRVEVCVDRDEAIRESIRRAGAEDVVLIAGKGHERAQIVPDGRGGVAKLPFDDRTRAREALEARAASEQEARAGAER